MREKELKNNFLKLEIPILENYFNDKISLYNIEFPVRTKDGIRYVDMILQGKEKLYIIEFKNKKIDYGAVEQLNRYASFVDKQLYRKNSIGIIVAPNFSKFEIEECKKNKILPIIYSGKGEAIIYYDKARTAIC